AVAAAPRRTSGDGVTTRWRFGPAPGTFAGHRWKGDHADDRASTRVRLADRVGAGFDARLDPHPRGRLMSSKQPAVELVGPADDGEAGSGEGVTLLALTTSAVLDRRLVEPDGEESDEDVSVRTPLGAALLGRHVGDVVSVDDDGQVVEIEVVE